MHVQHSPRIKFGGPTLLLSRVPAESRGCDGEGHTPPPRLRRGCIGQPGGQAFTRPRDFAPLERSLDASYWRGRATGTDFRPSIIGVGGACASRRTVCESGRERWRGGAGDYPTSGFRRTHHNTRPTCALTESNSHLFTWTRPLGRRFGVPRRQDSDACMCARATRHAMQAPDRARPP